MANVIEFLSLEGTIVAIQADLVQYIGLLEMLSRRSEKPFKTNINAFDLRLIECICDLNCLPNSHQAKLHPMGFATFQEMAEYVSLEIDQEDEKNEYLNDFLAYMGLEQEEEEVQPDQYEGWTFEMIQDQEREERELEAKCEAEYDRWKADWGNYVTGLRQ